METRYKRVIAYYYPSTETYVYNKEIAELTKLVYRQTNMRIIEQLEEIQKMDKTVDVFTIENTILGELRDKGYEYKKNVELIILNIMNFPYMK